MSEESVLPLELRDLLGECLGHVEPAAIDVVGERGLDAFIRLARYLLRPPVSLERLRLEPGLALYRHKRAARRDVEPFDPAELLARLLMHIPAPRLHLVRYYGRYSPDDELSRAERRRLRRGWAQLIRRVYEADPLLCKCGEKMRILSFITDPPVVTKILEHLCRTRRDPSRAPPSATEAPVALAS